MYFFSLIIYLFIYLFLLVFIIFFVSDFSFVTLRWYNIIPHVESITWKSLMVEYRWPYLSTYLLFREQFDGVKYGISDSLCLLHILASALSFELLNRSIMQFHYDFLSRSLARSLETSRRLSTAKFHFLRRSRHPFM